MKKEQQIDEMINEGLGAGRIQTELDKKQLDNPLTQENKALEQENTMTRNWMDIKELGKEMEQMKTEKEIKKEGKIPSPQER